MVLAASKTAARKSRRAGAPSLYLERLEAVEEVRLVVVGILFFSARGPVSANAAPEWGCTLKRQSGWLECHQLAKPRHPNVLPLGFDSVWGLGLNCKQAR